MGKKNQTSGRKTVLKFPTVIQKRICYSLICLKQITWFFLHQVLRAAVTSWSLCKPLLLCSCIPPHLGGACANLCHFVHISLHTTLPRKDWNKNSPRLFWCRKKGSLFYGYCILFPYLYIAQFSDWLYVPTSSPSWTCSSNERNNRTRRHACGSSAERRFKRSHRRSPLSDEYPKNHSSRHERDRDDHSSRHDRDREREKHHHRRKSSNRHRERGDRDRKRERRSYSSSQVSEHLSYLCVLIRASFFTKLIKWWVTPIG